MTPLLAAAERTRAEVVQLLIQRPEITLEEKIDSLELLGASYANDKDHYCLTSAYQFLYQTMELRYMLKNIFATKSYILINGLHSYHGKPDIGFGRSGVAVF